MKLRSVAEILPNTRVVLRIDADIPVRDGVIIDNSRLVKSLPTIRLLLEKRCKMAIIGHRGRPNGLNESFSLKPAYLELMTLLEPSGENLIESIFIENVGNKEEVDQALAKNQIVFLENLRFWKGERNNDPDFLKGLAEVCQFYVNDAIAESHRRARSIMLYRNLPGFYGLSFIDEVGKILRAVENPEKPLTVVLGGAKEDKLDYIEGLAKMADQVLVGGKLPTLIQNPSPASRDLPLTGEAKIVMAELREDKLDLSEKDINKFKEIIGKSKTIIWAGAMGKYEDESARRGTEEIAKTIAVSNAVYKVIAGGDTVAAVRKLGLEDKMDLICSGGGVTLELLTKGKLPTWE